ncbi:MAG: phage baseplate protein, partial [Planctomycetota bacterium]
TCRHKWQKVFDIVTFLWEEISLHAKGLLQEVHSIASVYGWREDDILSMSSARRQYYLHMVT